MLGASTRRLGLLGICTILLLLAAGRSPSSFSGVEIGAQVVGAQAQPAGSPAASPAAGAGLSAASPHVPSPSLGWQQVSAPGPSPRQYAAMAYDGTQMLLFGGCCDKNGGPLGDTWTFNGNSWTQQKVAGPSPREHASIAYDAAHNDVVLFGGCCDNGGNAFGDTWIWSGTTKTWSQARVSAANSPSARRGASLAFDGTQLVLFGGCCNANGALGDTWTWNGAAWTQQSGTQPPPRESAALAFAGTGAVLFGGQSGTTLLGDTWSWNGSAWTQASGTPQPAARDLAGIASTASGAVLFGGCCDSNNANLGDTWSWNGTAWTQDTLSPSPSPRAGVAMAGNPVTGDALLFGGCCDGSGNALGETWALGVSPTVASLSPASGVPAGGTVVTINGTGFATAAGATSVSFGGQPASNVSCTTTACTATSPSGVDSVDVTVTVSGLTSAVTSADRFTYGSAPVTLSCDPTTGKTVGVGGKTETCTVTLASGLNPGNAVEVTSTTPAVQSVTASDGSNTGISLGTTVGTGLSGAATHFDVTVPAITVGQATTLIVTALDANENVASSYTGTIQLTTTDSAAKLPSTGSVTCPSSVTAANGPCFSFTGANGVLSFHNQVRFGTIGDASVTATDTASSTIAGQTQVLVSAAPVTAATHLGVAAQSVAITGDQISVIVTALDATDNAVPGYTGTVALTSNNGGFAVGSQNFTFAAGDHGSKAFQVTLNTATSKSPPFATVTAAGSGSPALSGTSNQIQVAAAGPAGSCAGLNVYTCKLRVTVPGDGTTPATLTAGAPFPIVVSVVDSSNQVATDFGGAVSFTSTDNDPAVVLPAAHTFKTSDNGAFAASVTLQTAGARAITAEDLTDGLTASGQIGIHPTTAGTATTFAVVAPKATSVGVPVSVFVSALDANGNLATGYTGTVTLTSSDPSAALPAPYKFTVPPSTAPDNGTHEFSVTFATAYEQQISPSGCTGTGVSAAALAVGTGSGAYAPPSNTCSFSNTGTTVIPAGTVIGTETLLNGDSPAPRVAAALSAVCNSATAPASPSTVQCGSAASQIIASQPVAITGLGAEILTVPTITSFKPPFGPVAGGVFVGINGSAFDPTGADTVTFNNTAVEKLETCTTVQCSVVIPASSLGGAGDGLAPVVLTTAAGSSAPFNFSYAPVVTSISPQEGPAGGGTAVTITGTGFDTAGGTTVHFGGTASASVACSSSTSCTATSPAGTASVTPVDLTVTVNLQTSQISGIDQFTYTPPLPNTPPPPAADATCVGGGQSEGTIPGGKVVCAVVVDAALGAGDSVQVTLLTPSGFSGLLCSPDSGFTQTLGSFNGSANTCSFTSTSGAASGSDVGTMTFAVPSTLMPSTSPPPAMSFNAATCFAGGNLGSDVVQCGSTCNSAPCQAYYNWWTVLRFQKNPPAGPPPAPPCGMTTPGSGTTAPGNPPTFTAPNQEVCTAPVPVTGGGASVVPAPSVSSISPTTAIPGAKVVVSGTGFAAAQAGAQAGVTTITFGSIVLTQAQILGQTCTSADICQDLVSVPSGGGSNKVDVTVTAGGVTSPKVSADQFTFLPPPNAPTVTGVSPANGPALGGTSVTITGTNFGPAGGQVDFNFGPSKVSVGNCPPVTGPSGAGCTVTTPPGGGTVDVTATVGGQTSATNANDKFTYNADTSATGWNPLSASGPQGRSGAAMASSGQQTVLFGGNGANGVLGDTWVWNGTAWAAQTGAMSPAPRQNAAMASDINPGSVILFGGADSNGAPLDDTWVFTKGAWSQPGNVTETNSPPARYRASLAYDAATQTVILFGGVGANNVALADTWSWNGSAWTAICGTGQPGIPACAIGPLASASLAFDNATAKLVLFGGRAVSGAGAPQNGTWTFDGTNWVQLAPTNSPGPRNRAAMVYDQGNEKVVLFGGVELNSLEPADTWTFDGTTWTNTCGPSASVLCAPQARAGAGIAFGGGSPVVTLFGGTDGTNLLSDTATWGPAVAPTVTAVSPSSGAAAGGQLVTVTGTGFGTNPGATTVSFGGTATATNGVTCSSSTSCTVAVPAGTASGTPIDVLVTVEGRTSKPSPADQYTYTGGLANSTVVANPTTVIADGKDSTTVTVTLLDANNQPLPNRTITLAGSAGSQSEITPQGSPAAHIAATCASPCPATATTSTAGVARFSIVDGTVETVTYTATDTTDSTPLPQQPVVQFVSQVSATKSTVTASPTSVGADGSSSSTITVTLVNDSGAPISGLQVILNQLQSDGSTALSIIVPKSTGSDTTNSSGQATFTVTDTHEEIVIYTATVVVGNVKIAPSQAQVQFTSTTGGVDAANSTVTVDFSAAPDNHSFPATVTVTLLDNSNPPKPVGGKAVTLAANPGSHALVSVASGPSDSNGHVTFTVVDGTPEQVTLTATDTDDNNLQILQTPAVTFEPDGDVNLNGTVDATDALCVLRQVAGLGATAACSVKPPTISAADVNRNGTVDATDALCVLRLVAGLTGTGACPIFTPSASVRATAAAGDAGSAAAAPASVPVSTAAAAHLQLSTLGVSGLAGKQTSVKLTADLTGAGLAAWTVDIVYDPAQIQVTNCDAAGGALCNPAFAPGTLRISGASGAGLTGSQTLATLTFKGKGRPRLTSLTLQPVTLSDPQGASLLPAASPDPRSREIPR